MNAKLVSDKDLISEYLSGNENSLEILVLRHQSRIFNYIMMIVKNKHLANDLFQDTFFKVIKTMKSGNYNEEGKFLSWVLRIAHNLVIDYFRKNKRIPIVENRDEYDILSNLIASNDSIEDKMVNIQILDDVKKMVEYLPDEQKEVIQMRHYAEMSFKEIAEQTGVSINTALGRMRYALINLRKIVEENEINLSA